MCDISVSLWLPTFPPRTNKKTAPARGNCAAPGPFVVLCRCQGEIDVGLRSTRAFHPGNGLVVHPTWYRGVPWAACAFSHYGHHRWQPSLL